MSFACDSLAVTILVDDGLSRYDFSGGLVVLADD
jgi:hypothetical protein